MANITYDDTMLVGCQDGQRYSEYKARIGQMHSLQTTDRFVILAENSYLFDPCSLVNYDESLSSFKNQFSFEKEDTIKDRIYIINKCGGEGEEAVEARIKVPPFFITHVLGSYEDPETNKLHFDVLQYDDARPYEHWTDTDVIASGEIRDQTTNVTRYSINMEDWTVEFRNLITDPTIKQDFEFSTINPAYYGRPYKYGYMSQNVFTLNGAVVKLNVDTGEVIRKELPDGLFPTEPIFVADPEGTEENDGVILMSGVDGGNERGFIIVYDASNMEELYRGTAPKKTLLGLHSKFYSFHVGCSKDDCTPPSPSDSTESTNNGVGKFDAPQNWIFSVILVIQFMAANKMIH